jgi:hypothetical protein
MQGAAAIGPSAILVQLLGKVVLAHPPVEELSADLVFVQNVLFVLLAGKQCL